LDSLQNGNAPEFTPFFLVEGVLGIPKKALVKVYLHARQEFFEILSRVGSNLGILHNDNLTIDKVNETTAGRLQCLTKVMLLFDPEHMTAVNMRYTPTAFLLRKRLILKRHIMPAAELQFLNIMFTSPLSRHAKSPTLWVHRRFIIEHLPLEMSPAIQDEMSTVIHAAETHPKNYHAWTYARWIWLSLWNHPNSEAKWQFPQQSARIATWCRTNVSDISGWSFYLWFLGGDRPWREPLEKLQKIPVAVRNVVTMSQHIAPGHEAVWAFCTAFALGMEEVLGYEDRVLFVESMRYYFKVLESKQAQSATVVSEMKFVGKLLKRCRLAGMYDESQPILAETIPEEQTFVRFRIRH
jgi:Protein prenyltransferase alpha subunit repeat